MIKLNSNVLFIRAISRAGIRPASNYINSGLRLLFLNRNVKQINNNEIKTRV
jgi:hypothetical protein